MLKNLQEYNYGEELNLVLMIRNSQLRRNKKDKFYLMMQLSDHSETIRGNYWNASESDADTFSSGTLVEVDGKKEEYQGHPQIKIYNMHVVKSDDGYDLNNFIKEAPESRNEMELEINEYANKINNKVWFQIVNYLLDKWHERFYTYPAGKSNHHAVRGGLAYHTLSMLRDAEGLANNYEQVNRSLLYAGCILHDMGKVLELTGPVATQYTIEGNLVGHLVIIDEQIELAAQKLKIDMSNEDLLLLRHMVLSHHGIGEYGSPKRPALLEAELLHRIDDLDAMMYAVTKALQETKPGKFTEMIHGQNDKRFYRPNDDDALKRAKLLQ